LKRAVVIMAAATLPMLAVAQSCLEQVATFAERVCGEIQRSGVSQVVEANGQLKAEVSGIVSKVVGSGGGSVNGKVLRESYENVLRQDLSKELFNIRECRIKMVEVGRAEACKAPVTYRACRHPDFGRAGWQKSETLQQSSGWRSGGSNQQNWCNELVSGYVASRGLGSNYESTILGSSESSRKDFVGHVTYNYSCSVRIDSGPLYAERTDPRCGVASR
jgi:hypothetical protein